MDLDESIYAARCCDMRPPSPHVWLQPFDQVEDAEAIVHTRYQRLAADDPALAALRVVVQSWNERSLRFTRRLGFEDARDLTVAQSGRPVVYRIVKRQWRS